MVTFGIKVSFTKENQRVGTVAFETIVADM
jgi:hypothetical protein